MTLRYFPPTPTGRLQFDFWRCIERRKMPAEGAIASLLSLAINLIAGFEDAEARAYWVQKIVTEFPPRVEQTHANLLAQIEGQKR